MGVVTHIQKTRIHLLEMCMCLKRTLVNYKYFCREDMALFSLTIKNKLTKLHKNNLFI